MPLLAPDGGDPPGPGQLGEHELQGAPLPLEQGIGMEAGADRALPGPAVGRGSWAWHRAPRRYKALQRAPGRLLTATTLSPSANAQQALLLALEAVQVLTALLTLLVRLPRSRAAPERRG